MRVTPPRARPPSAALRLGPHRGHGYGSLGVLVSEDGDIAGHALLMRFGEPAAHVPLGLGVGLGVFGAEVDDTGDEVAAITITGAVDWSFDRVTLQLPYPVRVGVQVSYAPDVATFSNGTHVLDLLGRAEIDLSSWASAYVGYRHLEVGLPAEDATLEGSFQAGVRLGF